MSDSRFLDTNVLVYAFGTGDPRCDAAESLVAGGGIIGVQVLNEFTHVARRKLQWSWDQLDGALSVVEELLGPARPLTASIHARAVGLSRRHALPFCDALIVAAAEDAGCRWLISEDFQHGQRIGPLTIDNPFRQFASR
jgi:predicted nucleic acid-binding protein